MMRLRVIVLGLLCTFVGGCGGGTSGGPGHGAASRPAIAPGSGSQGTCWQVDPARWADPNYWNDDSPVVPCSKPHTTETVFVYALAHPTPHAALQVGQECHDHVRGYVGISDDTWIPWGTVLLLPSKKQIADGASWVRCDLYFPAATGKAGPREVSLRGLDAAVHPPVALWGCLDHQPDHARSQPYISCAAPHTFEATGNIIHTPPTSTYPTRRVRDHAARQCDRHVPHDAGLVPSVMWGSVVDGPDLSGACLFHRSDGRPLPPRS